MSIDYADPGELFEEEDYDSSFEENVRPESTNQGNMARSVSQYGDPEFDQLEAKAAHAALLEGSEKLMEVADYVENNFYMDFDDSYKDPLIRS